MNSEQRISGSIVLGLLMAGTGLLTRQAIGKGWEKARGEPPPKDQDNRETDLRDALLWAVVSGVSIGIARTLVQRTLVYRGKPELRKA